MDVDTGSCLTLKFKVTTWLFKENVM